MRSGSTRQAKVVETASTKEQQATCNVGDYVNVAPNSLVASSSDPIAVIRLQDRVLVDGNEALSRLTGHASTELLGRPVDELVVWLDPNGATSGFFGPLGRDEAVSNLPVAFRTRPWKLWMTRASALPVEIEGRSHALCTIRGTRPPTRLERHIAARVELDRIAEQHASWPGVAETALEAACRCLDWQAGAVWQVDPSVRALRCVAFGHDHSRSLKALETASRHIMYLPGEGPLGNIWLSGRPHWVADVTADQELSRAPAATKAAIRGWLAWPVLTHDRVVGVVELFSRVVRPPDGELLELTTALGRHFGRLLEHGDPGEAPFPATDSDMEPQHPGATDDPPTLLRELVASVGKLNGLLENLVAIDRLSHDPVTAALDTAQWQKGLGNGLSVKQPVGLTLKAVSERTGIPSATVRTWERRYGFIYPARSANGYRLYREGDISRLLTVKRLLSEGVRIRDAVTAVGALDDPEGDQRADGGGGSSGD